jgi:hypothetical protein
MEQIEQSVWEEDLNNSVKQLDLIDIHKTLHQTIAECTFFPVYSELLPRKTMFRATTQIS